MFELNVEVARDLLRRERAGERVTAELGPWTVWMLTAACQKMIMDLGPHAGEPFYTAGRSLGDLLDGAAREAVLASWRELLQGMTRPGQD